MLRIREGISKFHEGVFPQHQEHFARLAQGQSPEAIFITCADSRIDPALLTQTSPGDLFVIRNAGNFVPTQEGSGLAASVEYGVSVLKARHIVVCGHSHCGAVAAALDPQSAASLPAVTAWLAQAGPDLQDFQTDEEDRLFAAVKHNVCEQVARLRQLPCVAAAEARGEVELHGWVYRFETGEVLEYDRNTADFKPTSTNQQGAPS